MCTQYQNNVQDNKTYFCAGDIVTLRQDIRNKPIMLVVRKETSIFKHDKEKIQNKKSILVGIRCRWFTSDGTLQEALFSTKDLILL